MPIDRIITASIQDGAVVAADLAAGVPTRAQLPAGAVLQIATSTFDGVTTGGTSGVPSTITNGTQLFSVSFTPTAATNIILVQTSTIVISEEANNGDRGWLALWDGSTFIAANSGNALFNHYSSNFNVTHVSLNNSYVAGSTATRTISVRAGFDGGAGANIYINGNSTYNYTGSSARIQMTVWEIAA